MLKILFIVICLSGFMTGRGEINGIKFAQGLSWEQVKQKAKAENKYIFLDLFATWCGPCKMMDRDVYPNDSVGDFMNSRFVSVKIQMDSTGSDNAEVRSWYADARKINQTFSPAGYPSFLFFTPDGHLTFRSLGYKNVSEFLRLAEMALNKSNAEGYVKLDEYRSGKKDYSSMDSLAVFVKDVMMDTAAANSIAKDFKSNVLDRMSEVEVCTRRYLGFISKFSGLVGSKDNFFRLWYNEPGRADSMVGQQGLSTYMANEVIQREEFQDKLLKNGKPAYKEVDWGQLGKSVSRKYPKADIRSLMAEYRLMYYYRLGNWEAWARYKDIRIDSFLKTYVYRPEDLGVYIELNVYGAWDVFLHCNDKEVLATAIRWIDLAMKVDTAAERQSDYLDTKANLLYKLGYADSAIRLQDRAYQLSIPLAQKANTKNFYDWSDDFRKIEQKMKAGEPTYLEEGAVWKLSPPRKDLQKSK